MESFRLGYRPSLDGLRALAVIAVMLHHVLRNGTFLLPGGLIGVNVFFVLSGFLITAILLGEQAEAGRINLYAFYMRRILRLYPALLSLLAFLSLVLLAGHLSGQAKLVRVTPGSLLAAASYTSNWAWAFGEIESGRLIHTWSLAIEEQFYLIWPLVLLLMVRKRLSTSLIISVLLLAAVASSLARNLLWWNGSSWGRVFAGLDTRADSLLIGCIVGIGFGAGLFPRGHIRAAGLVGGIGLLVIVAVPLSRDQFIWGGCTISAVTGGLLIYSLVAAPNTLGARALSTPALVWVGRRSYALYLWHLPLFGLFVENRLGAQHRMSAYALATVVTFAAAAISWKFIEEPFLRLQRRYRSTQPLVPHSGIQPLTPATQLSSSD